jgi:hypothetical protein
MTTILLAGWILAAYYGLRAGGPLAIVRALRSPDVPRRYKLALALCALPVPGPFDELVAAALLARLARLSTHHHEEDR